MIRQTRRRNAGQGMTEYIIIVALVAIAAIGVYSARQLISGVARWRNGSPFEQACLARERVPIEAWAMVLRPRWEPRSLPGELPTPMPPAPLPNPLPTPTPDLPPDPAPPAPITPEITPEISPEISP